MKEHDADVNELILDGHYDKAIALAKKQLGLLPSKDWLRHWLYTELSSAYYEKRRYHIALRYAEKAKAIAPNCPHVLWHYAGVVARSSWPSDTRAAIRAYKKILAKSLNSLAHGLCGEGRPKALALRSDCRIRLAFCYRDLNQLQNARKWVKLFIRYFPLGKSDRTGGVESLEKKEFGVKWLAKVEKEIANESRQKANR